MKRTNPRAQAGVNLIELLLVLAIITAIVIAAFVLFPRVQAGMAANNTNTQNSASVAQVQTIYTKGNYSTLSNTIAIQADVFPEDMVDGNNVINQWGGAVTIQGSLSDGTPNATNLARYISITHEAVPSDVCKKLVPASASNFGTVLIEGDIVFDRLSTTKVDFSEGSIVAACDATDPVTITFVTR